MSKYVHNITLKTHYNQEISSDYFPIGCKTSQWIELGDPEWKKYGLKYLNIRLISISNSPIQDYGDFWSNLSEAENKDISIDQICFGLPISDSSDIYWINSSKIELQGVNISYPDGFVPGNIVLNFIPKLDYIFTYDPEIEYLQDNISGESFTICLPASNSSQIIESYIITDKVEDYHTTKNIRVLTPSISEIVHNTTLQLDQNFKLDVSGKALQITNFENEKQGKKTISVLPWGIGFLYNDKNGVTNKEVNIEPVYRYNKFGLGIGATEEGMRWTDSRLFVNNIDSPDDLGLNIISHGNLNLETGNLYYITLKSKTNTLKSGYENKIDSAKYTTITTSYDSTNVSDPGGWTKINSRYTQVKGKDVIFDLQVREPSTLELNTPILNSASVSDHNIPEFPDTIDFFMGEEAKILLKSAYDESAQSPDNTKGLQLTYLPTYEDDGHDTHVLSFYDDPNKWGVGVLLGGEGGTIVAAGEAGIDFAKTSDNTWGCEILHLVADENVRIRTNTQAGWDSGKEWIFHDNGNLYCPQEVQATYFNGKTDVSQTSYTKTTNFETGGDWSYFASDVNNHRGETLQVIYCPGTVAGYAYTVSLSIFIGGDSSQYGRSNYGSLAYCPQDGKFYYLFHNNRAGKAGIYDLAAGSMVSTGTVSYKYIR